MRAIKAALIAFILCAVASPALAAFTLTTTTMFSQSNSAAHSITTPAGTIPSGALIITEGNITGLSSAADAVVVTDTNTETWTVVQCANPGATTKVSFIGYAYATSGFTSKTITVSDTSVGGTDWTSGAFVDTFYLTGMAASSPEDVVVEKCGGSNTATTAPNLTSNAPTGAGEFFVANYNGNRNSVGATFTEDTGNGWTQSYGPSGGSLQADSGSTKTNSGSGALAHNPTVSSAAYAHQILAFCPLGGCVSSANKNSLLLGSIP